MFNVKYNYQKSTKIFKLASSSQLKHTHCINSNLLLSAKRNFLCSSITRKKLLEMYFENPNNVVSALAILRSESLFCRSKNVHIQLKKIKEEKYFQMESKFLHN